METPDFDLIWKDIVKPPGRTNHVRKNIHQTGKINQIRDIQLFCRNYSKNTETHEIKKMKDFADQMHRQNKVLQMQRWNDYQQKKYVAIEDFTNLRKTMLKCKQIITLIKLEQMIRAFQKNIQSVKDYRIFKANQFISYLKVCLKFKTRYRRYGKGKMDDIMRNRVRYTLIFFTMVTRAN